MCSTKWLRQETKLFVFFLIFNIMWKIEENAAYAYFTKYSKWSLLVYDVCCEFFFDNTLLYYLGKKNIRVHIRIQNRTYRIQK